MKIDTPIPVLCTPYFVNQCLFGTEQERHKGLSLRHAEASISSTGAKTRLLGTLSLAGVAGTITTCLTMTCEHALRIAGIARTGMSDKTELIRTGVAGALIWTGLAGLTGVRASVLAGLTGVRTGLARGITCW